MLKLASVDDYDSKFKSALQQEIDRTTYLFLWFAFGLAFTSMIILFLTGTNYEAVVIGAGILVSSVPLGLPIVIAMTQRVALDKLKVNGVIMKGSSHVEILGSTSCIITDKTGTLASDQLVVANAVFYTAPESKKKGGHLKITETGLAPPELMEEQTDLQGTPTKWLKLICTICRRKELLICIGARFCQWGREVNSILGEKIVGPNINEVKPERMERSKLLAQWDRYDHVPPSEPGGVGTKKGGKFRSKKSTTTRSCGESAGEQRVITLIVLC